ncbi:MAG: hypothetical protein ACR2NQ_05255 [Thermodesulfobacteriota bacterium]
MNDFTVQRRDMKTAFSKARVFAVSRKIVPGSGGFDAAVEGKLGDAGVRTVLFDRADEVAPDGTVFLAFSVEDTPVADRSVFFAAPASAPLEVKMLCAYVSNLDGHEAAREMADLIITAKKS